MTWIRPIDPGRAAHDQWEREDTLDPVGRLAAAPRIRAALEREDQIHRLARALHAARMRQSRAERAVKRLERLLASAHARLRRAA